MTTITATSALSRPVTDGALALDALRFILGRSLTEKPKRRPKGAVKLDNNLAWVFVAGRDFRPVAVRTYDTFEKKMAAGAVYFTPNTFFARREKTKDALRWLNALYVDIDDPDVTVLDVLDRVRDAGLPVPSVVNKTPNGLHVYWKIKRVRATKKALTLYSALLRSVATALDGDQAAATPERLLRIPTAIVYYNKSEYTLQDFVAWRDLNLESVTQKKWEAGPVVTAGILEHPAVQKLLEGVDQGQRDNTAFTLALAFKAAGYSQDKALNELIRWNFRNRPPLSFAQLRSKVTSAYKSKYHGPSAYWLSRLSGVPFKYQIIKKRGDDKVKKRPHGRPDLKPAARAKLLAMLRENGGSIQTRNQTELGKQLGVSGSTAWYVIAALKQEGLLKVETKRLGKSRGAITTYTLIEDSYAPKAEAKADTGENITSQQNAIHYGGGVAGGALRPSATPGKGNVVTFPGPRSGRDQGEGAG